MTITTHNSRTQRHEHVETVAISYIIRANTGATVTKSRIVWGTCGIDGGYEFDHAMQVTGKTDMV